MICIHLITFSKLCSLYHFDQLVCFVSNFVYRRMVRSSWSSSRPGVQPVSPSSHIQSRSKKKLEQVFQHITTIFTQRDKHLIFTSINTIRIKKKNMTDNAGHRRCKCRPGTNCWHPPVEVTQFWHPPCGFGARFFVWPKRLY